MDVWLVLPSGRKCPSALLVHEGTTDVNDNFRYATAHILAVRRENVEVRLFLNYLLAAAAIRFVSTAEKLAAAAGTLSGSVYGTRCQLVFSYSRSLQASLLQSQVLSWAVLDVAVHSALG